MKKSNLQKLKFAFLALALLISGSGLFTAQAQAIDEESAKKIAAFSEDIVALPNFADSYVHRGNVYLGINKLAEAFADASKALMLAPDNLGALLLRGKIKTRGKDYDGAIADTTVVITSNYSGRDQGYSARGEAYEKKGDFQKAYVDYKKALEIFPNSEIYIGNVSRVEAQLKNQSADLAAPELNFTSAENRKKADAAYNEADKFIRKLDWQAAVDSYTKAIEFDPQFAAAFKARAGLYGTVFSQFDKALADYKEALRLKPDYHDAFAARGDLYYINNKPDLALADYNEALRIYPDNTDALRGRGRIYSKLKRYDNSITDWEKYLSIYPNANDAALIRSYIAIDRQAIARSTATKKNPTGANLLAKLEVYSGQARELSKELSALGAELKTNTATPARTKEIYDLIEQKSLSIRSLKTEALKLLDAEPDSAPKTQLKTALENDVAAMNRNLETVARYRYNAEEARTRAEAKIKNSQSTTQSQPPVRASSTPEPQAVKSENTIDKFLRLMNIAITYQEETKAYMDKYKALPSGVKNDQQLIDLAAIIQPRFEKANELFSEPISIVPGSNYPPQIIELRKKMENMVIKNKKDAYYWSGMNVYHSFEKPLNESEEKEKIIEAQMDAAIKAGDATGREAARLKYVEQLKISKDAAIKLSNAMRGFTEDSNLISIQQISTLRSMNYDQKLYLINHKK